MVRSISACLEADSAETAIGSWSNPPMVEPGQSVRYTFVPKPVGTRWYHSHDVAGTDLARSLYSGMYGFLIVEPANDPGRYDQEVLLAAHHWDGRWVSLQDIRRGGKPRRIYSCASALSPPGKR